MITVFKYELMVADQQEVVLPVGAIPLAVQLQGKNPCLWAQVDDLARSETRRIRILGTGHNLETPNQWRYISTFQLAGGQLIFHVYIDRTAIDHLSHLLPL